MIRPRRGRPAPRRPEAGVFLVLSIALVVGCSTAPERRLAARAAQLGLAPLDLGGAFQLRGHYREGRGRRLHVYLDGDGTPWVRGRYPARNPTPRRPLALDLLALDPAPVLYLNRPCYGTASLPPPCRAWLWTHGRYSEEVVAALDAALDQALALTGHRSLVLLGYSGGGSLAVLLANRRRDVDAVVTVAANLEIGAWTRHHGYEPLDGSLNPAAVAPAPPAVLRWHLLGGRDRRVPPAVTRAGAAADPHARVLEYPDFDHVCCWQRAWPQTLARLRRHLESAPGPVR